MVVSNIASMQIIDCIFNNKSTQFPAELFTVESQSHTGPQLVKVTAIIFITSPLELSFHLFPDALSRIKRSLTLLVVFVFKLERQTAYRILNFLLKNKRDTVCFKSNFSIREEFLKTSFNRLCIDLCFLNCFIVAVISHPLTDIFTALIAQTQLRSTRVDFVAMESKVRRGTVQNMPDIPRIIVVRIEVASEENPLISSRLSYFFMLSLLLAYRPLSVYIIADYSAIVYQQTAQGFRSKFIHFTY